MSFLIWVLCLAANMARGSFDVQCAVVGVVILCFAVNMARGSLDSRLGLCVFGLAVSMALGSLNVRSVQSWAS